MIYNLYRAQSTKTFKENKNETKQIKNNLLILYNEN